MVNVDRHRRDLAVVPVEHLQRYPPYHAGDWVDFPCHQRRVARARHKHAAVCAQCQTSYDVVVRYQHLHLAQALQPEHAHGPVPVAARVQEPPARRDRE